MPLDPVDISIVIVNWNTSDLLDQCLRSLYASRPLQSFETIVVDNASSDDSVDMVQERYPDTKLIEATDNLGFAKANNLAIGASRGKAILLLNSDTLVHGDVIDQSYRQLMAVRETGAVGCRVLNADGSDQQSTSLFPSFLNLTLQTLGFDRIAHPLFQRYRMGSMDRTKSQSVETLSGCYLMAKREVFETVGLLDENFFFFGEETDWCRRARCKGYSLQYAPCGTITHFGGGSSKGLNHRRDLMLTEATIRLHRKHSGAFAAACCFTLLLLFNLSRALFWTVGTCLAHTNKATERARHFRNVVKAFPTAWPTRMKGDLA